MLEVRWYYRPAEIPPNLYHLLIEDRYHENRKFIPVNSLLVHYSSSLPFFPSVCNGASSGGSVSQCLYKSLYMCIGKCHSFSLSFFYMKRVREHFTS
jgi:hypothetical protein